MNVNKYIRSPVPLRLVRAIKAKGRTFTAYFDDYGKYDYFCPCADCAAQRDQIQVIEISYSGNTPGSEPGDGGSIPSISA